MTDHAAALATPTFLVGSERSGTTLLRLMLDHHPEISFNPEFEYAVSQMGDDGSFPDMESYYHFLTHDFIFPGAHFSVDKSLDYRALMHDFLRQKLTRDGKMIIGATVHHHFNRLLHLWPEARFIHILRDPRDVARSVIGMGWAGNVWVGADRWVEAELIWESMVSQLPDDRHTHIRYETLIENPREELARLCRFMGAEFHEDMFSYADKSTYDKPDPTLVYQWRKKLSDEEVALVEAKCGTLLTDRGYELSGLPKREVSATEVAKLESDSRKLARRFRIKRYGLPLVLGSKIARTIRFSWLEDKLQLRMNEIGKKHIK